MADNKSFANNSGITKEQSTQLQGVAILLMIYHHFFNDLSLFDDKLLFWNPEWVVRVAWFGKICVGIFAFVSGYGMSKVLDHGLGERWPVDQKMGQRLKLVRTERFLPTLKICGLQALRLLIRYWVILIVFLLLLCACGKKEFAVTEFFQNFFCLSASYNGAFWYVQQYLIMLGLLVLFEAFGGVMAAGAVLWGIAALAFPQARAALDGFFDGIRIAFVLVFFAGYFLAKSRAFQGCLQKLFSIKLALRTLFGLLMITAVFGLRVFLADSPAYAKVDFVLAPLFSVGFLLCIKGWGEKAFEAYGKISAYLWLTHLFVFDLTKDFVLERLELGHLAFFVTELILCTLVGVLCKLAERGGTALIKRLRK